MWMRVLLPLCLMALLSGPAFAKSSSTKSAFDALSADKDRPPVPKFSLKTLKGKRVKIEKLKGKVVVISFWATWCKPCKRELDDLKKIYKDRKADGLEVLAIATDGPETFSEIRGVVKRHKWKFPILPDKEGSATSILNPRGTVPYSMYIDRQGRIAHSHEGYNQGDAEKMIARIQALLDEKSP